MRTPAFQPSPPRRALILAAGLGMRLRPLTWKTPKPLMTVWGVPLIDHAIASLRRWGVAEFAINTHWRAGALRDHLAARWPELPCRISHEPEILGTGGALLPLRDFLEGERQFWIFNADVLATLDGPALAAQHRAADALATLWLTDTDGPRTVELADDGRIANFRSPRPQTPGTWTFTGIHVVSGRVYRYLEATVPAGIVTAYERALAAGERVAGAVLSDTFWADSGTPAALLRLHRDVRRCHRRGLPGGEYYDPALDLEGRACVDRTAHCEHNAAVEDCVIAAGARIAPGVRLTHCLVGAGTTVTHDARNAVLAASSDFEDERVDAAIGVLGWTPSATTVEAFEARGSDRAFFRLATPGQRAMLVVYGSQRAENARYAGHAEALHRAGVPVPAVLAQSPAARWLVLEDLGDDDLQGRVGSLPPSEWRRLYAIVLETTIRLHRDGATALGDRPLEPGFDARVYRWEHELLTEHLLRRRLRRGEDEIAAVLDELAALSRPLEAAPRVIVHRDLQSTNIFFRQGRAYLLDFQGLRTGPAAYDLASLLCDPYVCLPRELRQTCLRDYAARVPWGAETVTLFPVAAVQRLSQALGAYARLAAIPGTERFAAHIPSAARLLLEELDECAAAAPRLRALMATLA